MSLINPALALSAIGLMLAIFLAVLRAMRGPTLYDRVLAVNAIGTMVTLLIALMGLLVGTSDFTDIAMLYALVNFVSTVAVLKFFRYRGLSDSARHHASPPSARAIFSRLSPPDTKGQGEQSAKRNAP